MVNTAKQSNIQKSVSKVLGFLNDKNREVLERLFGIGIENAETLEAIGRSHGITRERVRQIQEYGLKKLSQGEAKEILTPVFNSVKDVITSNGGIVGEKHLFSVLSNPNQNAYFALAIRLMSGLAEGKETDDITARYALDHKILEKSDALVLKVHSILESKSAVVSTEELDNIIARESKLISKDLNLRSGNIILLSKIIKLGPFGDYGLAYWPAVTPKGVRDKAHLVFEKEQRPLHFTEISSLIDKYFVANLAKKRTHPQTVHNELIKDPRFILIGRGLYALSEWGYEPGTVKDVLVQIMKEEGRPLAKGELLNLVSDRRFVKPNTVLLNLQNKNYFKKSEGNKYYLA